MTALPWVVVNTHAHFDHCFGNATFAGEQPQLPIWGHAGCRTTLAASGDRQREYAAGWLGEGGRPEEAGAVAEVRVLPPGLPFTGETVLELGGRDVLLQHPGTPATPITTPSSTCPMPASRSPATSSRRGRHRPSPTRTPWNGPRRSPRCSPGWGRWSSRGTGTSSTPRS